MGLGLVEKVKLFTAPEARFIVCREAVFCRGFWPPNTPLASQAPPLSDVFPNEFHFVDEQRLLHLISGSRTPIESPTSRLVFVFG